MGDILHVTELNWTELNWTELVPGSSVGAILIMGVAVRYSYVQLEATDIANMFFFCFHLFFNIYIYVIFMFYTVCIMDQSQNVQCLY